MKITTVAAIFAIMVAFVTLLKEVPTLTARRRLREALSQKAAILAALPVDSRTREAIEKGIFDDGKRLALAERRRRPRSWWWVQGVSMVLLFPSLLQVYAGFLEGVRLSREMGFSTAMRYVWETAGDPPATPFLQTLAYVASCGVVAWLLLQCAYFRSRREHRREMRELEKMLAAERWEPFARTTWATVEQSAAENSEPRGRRSPALHRLIPGPYGRASERLAGLPSGIAKEYSDD